MATTAKKIVAGQLKTSSKTTAAAKRTPSSTKAKPSKSGRKSGASRTAERTSVPVVKQKKPLRERIRLAWHVLKGNNICD